MKHIKTVAMSLLLANSFSSNEVTWKEIKTEIKRHIEEVESDFSALETEIQKIYKDYKAIQGETEFDNLEAETVKTKRYNRTTKGDKRANKKKSIEAKKENNKTDKQDNETYKKKKIEEIKNNIEEIINNKDQLKINQDEVKLTKIESIDIEKIKKDLTSIKNIYEKMIKINKLKTFRELQEFTKEFSHVKFLKEKTYNRQYLYSIVYTAIKENIAVPFLNIIKTEKHEKQNSEKIASSFYPYDMAIENLFIQDDNYHNNVMKNILNEEKIKKEKETLKEKYKRSLDITVFTALSNKQDKKTLEENAPAILTMLETLKGTEAENKGMAVRQALEIFNNFISQTKNNITFDTNKIREAKKEKPESGFEEKKSKRIEKLQKEIEKLEEQKEKSTSEKDKKILEKEINALKKTIDKITGEELKDQKFIEEKSNETNEGFSTDKQTKESNRGILAKEKRAARGKAKKEAANKKQEAFNQNMTEEEKKKAAERAKTFVPKEKMQTSQGLREAIKERNHKMTEEEKKKFESGPNFNTIDESDTQEKREKAFKEKRKEEKRKNYETYDNKEELRTSSFDITKQELAEAKKNKFNEI